MDQQVIHLRQLARNDIQAVALSNFEGGGPTVAPKEGDELKNVRVKPKGTSTRRRTKLRDGGERL
jgi:hypothetical protein